jgi:HEAT repeat protein
MTVRPLLTAVVLVFVLASGLSGQAGGGGAAAAPQSADGQSVSAADVAAAIDKLGSFDLPVRTAASRTVRRAAAAIAVPALTRAAREHADGYVRYRALVLLAGFGEAPASTVMRELMADGNGRLRMVAYGWFEHHPDPGVLPTLMDALGKEQSEFVRPALLRAVAAHGDDARARTAMQPYIMRGQDDFRGALIDALGDYRGAFALDSIIEVAKLDGPLQDDAVTAIGKIGNASGRAPLVELQRNGPREVQPAIAAALFLLGSNTASNEDYLKKSLAFGATNATYQPLVRATAHALAVLAIRNNAGALSTLLDAGVAAKDPARAAIALSLGRVALRNTGLLLDVLEPRADRDAVGELLQEAFDMLSSEDYALERFYVEVRRQYWASAPGSPRRRLAEALIQKLEF